MSVMSPYMTCSSDHYRIKKALDNILRALDVNVGKNMLSINAQAYSRSQSDLLTYVIIIIIYSTTVCLPVCCVCLCVCVCLCMCLFVCMCVFVCVFVCVC